MKSTATAPPQRRGGLNGDDDDSSDELVPDPEVWREFGISSMTGWRWTNDAELGFPPRIKIRNRNFRSRRMLESFKTKLIRTAVTRKAGAAS